MKNSFVILGTLVQQRIVCYNPSKALEKSVQITFTCS